MYRSKLNSAGVKEFLQYELKFMNELYSKIKSFKDFECYAQSEPAEALQLQLGELKKNKQCIDFFFSSSKILTVENLNKYSGSLLNDKSEEYIFTNLFFHILKEIALGATFLFQKILYLYVTSPTKNENLFEKIYNMALTKKFASFFMFCQNFFSGLFSKIWQDMEKNIFNDAQKHYLFTFMLLDVTTNTEKSCEKDKFWTIFLDELSQYKDVYCMQALDLENNEVFQEVHENLIKFFKTTTNPNILETFYLACQPNEVLKTNDKLLDDFWKNPLKQHLLRQKIIEEYLPKQIYSTEFKNKQLVALTVSKGYILLNKSYTYKGNSKGKKFVYMAKLFLIILHEILHKIRLLENSNCLLDLETEKKLGVYDFRGEIGHFFESKVFNIILGNLIDYIDEKNAFTIFDIGNFETEKISIIQKLFHELNEKLESQQNLKKKYECRNRYWKCRPGISLETDSDEEERETDQEWS